MDKFIEIAHLDNQFQADLLSLELQKKNIPFFIKSFYDTAYQNIYQIQKGWGKIEAPKAYQEEIMAIIASLDMANADMEEEEKEDE